MQDDPPFLTFYKKEAVSKVNMRLPGLTELLRQPLLCTKQFYDFTNQALMKPCCNLPSTNRIA
jgi:hypothetical protein